MWRAITYAARADPCKPRVCYAVRVVAAQVAETQGGVRGGGGGVPAFGSCTEYKKHSATAAPPIVHARCECVHLCEMAPGVHYKETSES